MKAFIDTSAFIAYFIKQDEFHDDAVAKFKLYRQQNVKLLTSDYILDELQTWFSAKQPKNLLEKLIYSLQRIEEHGEIRVFSVDKPTFRKAQKVLLKFSEHKISFTDATSYVLYKDFALDEVFTLDDDFKKMRISTSF